MKRYIRSSESEKFTTEQLLDVLESLGIDTTVHEYVGTNFTSRFGRYTTKFQAPGDYAAIIFTLRRPFGSKTTDLATFLQKDKGCYTIDDVLNTYGRSLDEAIERSTSFEEGVCKLLDRTTRTYIIPEGAGVEADPGPYIYE